MNIWMIIDLEATCWEDGIMPNGERQSVDTMEIIEIGCAVAKENGELLHSHSITVRPTENPLLRGLKSNGTKTYAKAIHPAPMAALVV